MLALGNPSAVLGPVRKHVLVEKKDFRLGNGPGHRRCGEQSGYACSDHDGSLRHWLSLLLYV